MARKIEQLSYADLVKTATEPRFDHPGRRNIVMAPPKSDLPKCYRRFRDTGEYAVHAWHGEFVPNPPGCVGIRKLPKGVEVFDVESMQ